MAKEKAAQKSPRRPVRKTSNSSAVFSAEERAAMREYVQERKTARSRGRASAADGESDVRAKIAEMADSDRAMAERIHELVKAAAPELVPRTWYGMPAYAKDDKVLCFFQPSQKFKARYSTLGFSDTANLDEGGMWATAFAVKKLGRSEEAKIRALVKRAVAQG